MTYYMLTFQSTHHYMRAEKLFDDLDYEFELANIPPEISADCGLGLKFDSAVDEEKVYTIIKRSGIEIDGLYYIEKNDQNKDLEKIK